MFFFFFKVNTEKWKPNYAFQNFFSSHSRGTILKYLFLLESFIIPYFSINQLYVSCNDIMLFMWFCNFHLQHVVCEYYLSWYIHPSSLILDNYNIFFSICTMIIDVLANGYLTWFLLYRNAALHMAVNIYLWIYIKEFVNFALFRTLG